MNSGGVQIVNRRKLMIRAAGSVLAISALPGPGIAFGQADNSASRQQAIAAWRGRIRSILDRQRLPIIDIEATYIAGKTNVAQMIDRMNELDVAQIAFAPAFAANGQPALDLHHEYPQYFIPTASSGEFPRWWSDPLAFLAGVKEDLGTGRYFLMGEHEFRHYPSPEQAAAGQTFRDISIALDGPAGQALFKLGEETGIAFQLHYEIEDRLMPALESMLAQHPKAKVIWCHAAMVRYPDRAKTYNPDYVGSLIERFPGLHFDLAVPDPAHVYLPSGVRDSTLFSGRRLDDKWQALLEKYPERFLAASDYRPPIENFYKSNIQRQRALILDVLSERSRHLIAYGNAWRLITGEPWSA
jgi:hypothetical protein